MKLKNTTVTSLLKDNLPKKFKSSLKNTFLFHFLIGISTLNST